MIVFKYKNKCKHRRANFTANSLLLQYTTTAQIHCDQVWSCTGWSYWMKLGS